MPYITQTRDLTKQYLQYGRSMQDFRPIAATTYNPGYVVQLVSQGSMVYPDEGTVQLPGTGASQSLIMGVVADTWPGFAGAGLPGTYLSPTNVTTLERGTVGVLVIVRGFSSGVWLDQSGTGATAVTNGTILIPSRATAGYAQGTATVPSVGFGTVGAALLPISGDSPNFAYNTIPAAASLVQASQTATVGGTPAAGDILTVTIQSPYTTAAPGVAQTTSISTAPLTAAQATSTTTAATALAAALNASGLFSTTLGYYVATSSAAIVTVTVNGLATPFQITAGSGTYVQSIWNIGLSGAVANAITFACSVSAGSGSTLTAGGSTLASGTGFKGQIPALITGSDV